MVHGKLLAALLFLSLVLVLAWSFVTTYKSLSRRWRARHGPSTVPPKVVLYLEQLQSTSRVYSQRQSPPKAPKSFGVFLGEISNPPTPSQTRLLSQWDITVVDPLRPGVIAGVSSQRGATFYLGRLDVASTVGSKPLVKGSNNVEAIESLGVIAQIIESVFNAPRLSGVLLANWQEYFTPGVCNALIRYLHNLGFAVYLEISPPTYIPDEYARSYDMQLISGIACRNGTVLSTGMQCDPFMMQAFWPALRALAAHASMGCSTVLIWDTVDDNVEVQQAVIKRSYDWCRFNSALSWIGPASALFDANIAQARTVPGEPLGAMMWLKNEDTIAVHDLWRLNDKITPGPAGNHDLYGPLQSIIPNLKAKLALLPASVRVAESSLVTVDESNPAPKEHLRRMNPILFSAAGQDYTGMGCFQIGLDCTARDFEELVDGQRRLRELNLLQRMKAEELRPVRNSLRNLLEAPRSWTNEPAVLKAVRELSELVEASKDEENDRLRIHVGLHSGLRTSMNNQFMGVYEMDLGSGIVDIYLSAKAQDFAGAILHTFLSSQGLTRAQCYLAEIALSEQNGRLSEEWNLPPRLVNDIEGVTPAELILFLQRLVRSHGEDCRILSTRLRACCEYQLMERPSIIQLRAMNSTAYLRGEMSAEQLVDSRIAWYRERGCRHPTPQAALSLFREIDALIPVLLVTRQSDQVTQMEKVLHTVLQKGRIDASADLFALSVFCAFRKLALNEVYLEVLDRNPLPQAAASPDQAACFAEMFALGSRCESYFDVTPNVMGKVLQDRYRAYYKVVQPPCREDSTTEIVTAYASKLIDLDPHGKPEDLPTYYQITFLSIFAVPALVDIILLTTIGRGLYLTTYMSDLEKRMATTALFVALFLTGFFGTWIGQGGSYYLHSMAFPAMNMFVITRFTAGVAIVVGGGLISLIVIGVSMNFYAGMVFFCYLILLMTYLSLLATLSIYQLPGFMFKSGRMTIMACLPILLISPIMTLWVHGNDLLVYLCVLAGFLVCLIFGARKTAAEWSTWYLRIPTLTDHEVTDWYTKRRALTNADSGLEKDDIDISTTPIPRQTLLAEVLKEYNRNWWNKGTNDETVKKISDGYAATMFLMVWYCKYSRTQMPFRYSPTWNLQCKAAIDTLKDMQKGLKLHNAFIHWRHGGDEVWVGVLYFVVALLDKWVALISGQPIVGLSAANSDEFRLAVGFGLAYYLVAAIFLDATAMPLWAMANKKAQRHIASMKDLERVTKEDAQARRKLYWSKLTKFFFLHIWGLAITSALMWTFEGSRPATVMYLAYVVSYTGLLWYQYNRVFAGMAVLPNLAVAAVLGLVVGPVLHRTMPDFAYSSVIALGLGTWTVCLLSIRTADVGWPRFKKEKPRGKTAPPFYSSSSIGAELEPSQAILAETFDTVSTLPAELRYRLNPSQHPGSEVINILKERSKNKISPILQAAFPSGDHLIWQAAESWSAGETVVELVPTNSLIQHANKLRAISRIASNQLHVYVFVGQDLAGDEYVMDIRRNCKVIAEAIIQAISATKFGFSNDHSNLAELLALTGGGEDEISVPQGVQRQLENCATERRKVIANSDKTLLRYLLLGLDCDTAWDNLPREIRFFLLSRCYLQRCYLSDNQASWIRSQFCQNGAIAVDEYIARCNLGVALTTLINEHAIIQDTKNDEYQEEPREIPFDFDRLLGPPTNPGDDENKRLIDRLLMPVTRIHQILVTVMKFLVVAMVADPEFHRELDYIMAGKPKLFAWPVTFLLSGLWSYCKTLQQIMIPLVLLHGREKVQTVRANMKGIKTVLYKNRVVIGSLTGPSTSFFRLMPDGSTEMYQYSGSHTEEPEGRAGLLAINTYTDNLILRRREHYSNGGLVNRFQYEYSREKSATKLPIQRHCVEGKLSGRTDHYDERGYITSGSYTKDDNLVEFTLYYRRNAKFDDELLRGEFVFPHIRMTVSWSVPPPSDSKKMDKWIPNPRVMEATYIEGTDVYHCKWAYEHNHHPLIETKHNGILADTPDMITYDWFDILRKPQDCSFLSDNPIFSFNSTSSNFLSRIFRLNTRWYPVSTSKARTYLWENWKKGKDLDAVTTRWLDEVAMRKERVLKPYWSARDFGRLRTAEAYIDTHVDTIMARINMDPAVGQWTNAAYRISDLYSFGQGGDCTITTRTVSQQLHDSDRELHVLAMDTGTWPNEGGGVSACRRDMVNDLSTIRWHVLAEAANDFGVPKFQIERNVQSLSILPLWGLDYLTPNHGVFENYLDSAVQRRSNATNARDIERNFLPILTSLVKCARAINVTQEHILEGTKALVDLNQYFQSSRHWSDVWLSETAKQKWRELWLSDDVGDNARSFSQWMDAERPTLQHLDNALDMWHRYLFIISTPVPEKIPDVFQASHHFTGASYGVLCKVLRGCTLHVWDHCISWREVTVFLSSAMSWDPPFVGHTLMCLSRIAGFLILHHADVVLPCADFFNPGWEIELGSQQGTVAHRRTIARKIDPVVNGICNMDSFKPIEKIKSLKPTVVMLSHVRFVKDIKNAIMAADIIVNEWGIKDYQLDVYGDMERAPTYAVECQEIIAAKSLRDHVCLRGLGSPSKVLENAWIFLNSSISEGLPLAMGEAALTGVPVVCTDVGASFRVVTDPATGKKFSAVVAPNDAYSLARAQINVMGLMDEWAEFSGDDSSVPGYTVPKIPLHPTPDDAKCITDRMFAKQEQRRALGMRGRANVLSNFTADRYLREHEQMLWIGKLQNLRKKQQHRRSSFSSSSEGLHRSARASLLLGVAAEQAAFNISANNSNTDLPLMEVAKAKRRFTQRLTFRSTDHSRSESPSSFRSNYLSQARRGTVHRTWARELPPPNPTRLAEAGMKARSISWSKWQVPEEGQDKTLAELMEEDEVTDSGSFVERRQKAKERKEGDYC